MAVPASFNDLVTDAGTREFFGDIWYQRRVRIPRGWSGERIVLTFESATHRATVWVDGVEVGLVGDVAGDLPITVDARTGEVTRADGVPMPGILSRRSRLAALRVSPGTHEISFSGYSPTGTARVDVAWRPATWGL